MKAALSAIALAVALTAGSYSAAEAADCKVGVAMYTLSAPYFAAQVAAAVDQAKKAGCEVSQSDGQNDMAKQIADVEDMVSKGVKLLILKNIACPRGESVNVAEILILRVDAGVGDFVLRPRGGTIGLDIAKHAESAGHQ